jgi:hypothetical protein
MEFTKERLEEVLNQNPAEPITEMNLRDFYAQVREDAILNNKPMPKAEDFLDHMILPGLREATENDKKQFIEAWKKAEAEYLN